MLDQNTDRMWFVIGAVIVGAAIIFIANGTIPELFASVTESFEEASDNALSVVDEIGDINNLLVGASIVADSYVMDNGDIGMMPGESVVGPVSVEPGQDYVFALPNETNFLKIAYYDSSDTFIPGSYRRVALGTELHTISPSDAAYVRMSATWADRRDWSRNNSHRDFKAGAYSPINRWWFGLKENR